MKILVTGATGFIGGHLCRRLVAEGHQLLALVRNPGKADELRALGVELIEGDLSLFAQPEVQLPECDVVIHLAGVVTAERPEEYEAINFQAVADLVGCLSRQRWQPKRLVFASSLAAAGPTTLGRPLTETDPCQPIDPYGEAKYRAELMLSTAPFPTTAFRPSLVFGPRDPASFTFFRMAKRRLGFRVGGVPQQLSFIDVRDLAEAILAMAQDDRPGHQVYFATSEEVMDTESLWQVLEQVFGHRLRVLVVPRAALRVASKAGAVLARVLPFRNQLDDKQLRQILAPAFLCSAQKLQRELGWAPKHDLVATFTNALQGYRADGWL